MKLSIIIPVYKVEDYIKRCLESVINQEIDNFEVECLLINDCTPDNSMIIAKEILDKYNGPICFVIINHHVNKGQSEARNNGIKRATGDFVLFVDSDDYLLPNSLSRLMSAKERYPYTDIIIGNVYEHKYKKTQHNINNDLLIKDGIEARRWMLTNEFSISPWNKLFNRQFLIDNNLYFEIGIMAEDIPWTYVLYTKISSILIIPEVTYSYWYNESSLSNSYSSTDKAVRSYVIGCHIMLNMPYEKELYIPQHLFIFRWLLNAINISDHCESNDILEQLYSLRDQLFTSTLHDFRLILSLFFLLLYKPFHCILQFRIFRHNYNKISKTVYYFAQLFNFLHH